ncbi:MAG: hypothetical protein H0X40_12605 [Chthoniobacterales bacterium]|nr:hypothetical protein [Chthoniobacterales bacterium]
MRLPNFGYHFARWEGSWCRKSYRAALPLVVRLPLRIPGDMAFNVFSYSSEDSLPEQVRSIRSFLRHVGRPTRFTVVSDGSHSSASIRLLRAIDPAVSVESSGQHLPPGLPEKFLRYVSIHPTGKQLGLIMSLPRDNEPALYADSDVLFFPGAKALTTLAEDHAISAYYLSDCRDDSNDKRIFRSQEEELDPVNTGLLLLFRKLDWSLAIQRFRELKSDPTFFTNQTLTHLTMHANGARPLDARRFVLKLDDQFIYPDRYASREIVLRHYVNPVRHKLWTRLLWS